MQQTEKAFVQILIDSSNGCVFQFLHFIKEVTFLKYFRDQFDKLC